MSPDEPRPEPATDLDRPGRPAPVGATVARFAWLSIAAALTTMAMKGVAAWLTGSVALFSDALESGVNLVAAVFALVAITVAARPPDESHPFGHTKAEFFSATVEGAMIVLAAVLIANEAIRAFIDPRPLESLGVGLAVTVAAALVNLGASLLLRRAGRRHRSVALEADGRHLMTDVVTSAGVVVGVALVWLTGWERLDPIVALVVAVNIVWTGLGLIRRSSNALMDASITGSDQDLIEGVLAHHRGEDVRFHALRTRQAGSRSFAVVHMLVPGVWSVQRSHDLAEQVEAELAATVPGLVATIHVEPIGDVAGLADAGLDWVDERDSGLGDDR